MIGSVMRLGSVLMALVLAMVGAGVAAANFENTIRPEDWAAFRDRFVMEDGRVVDDANKGISHSESQGYGLLLAFAAGDRGSFERIFGFTSTQLLIRDDGLAAWKWDPNASPHIVDVNDASDGDILIAYALALAGKAWDEPRYLETAKTIATAIGTRLFTKANGRLVLLPGVAGFAPPDRPEGTVVVNPSYWVFEAFPVLKELAPGFAWDEVASSGLEIVAAARFGSAGLPADWVEITSKGLAPAEGFPAVFGYNAIRIPLYMIRAGITGPFLDPFARQPEPSVVELTTGRATDRMSDPGYRLIDALVACTRGTPVPPELLNFTPTNYYPSTLHLLGLSYLASRGGTCG
jgi:endoglucanase